MTLYDELAAVVDVRAHPDWATQTNDDRVRSETSGIVLHWDAIKSEPSTHYYLHSNRFGQAIYHIVIRRDGSVDLLSQGYVWHAGKGDSDVLEDLRNNVVPGRPTKSDMSGNGYLFSVSINYHPDEGPMASAQYWSLVKVTKVLLTHFDLNTNQIIDHRGWTPRKRDIDNLNLISFRSDVAKRGGEYMALNEMEKLVIDIAWVLGGDGRKAYWYAKDNNDPEIQDIRNAIKPPKDGAAHERLDKLHSV